MKIKSLLVLAVSSTAFMSSCACSNYHDQQFLNQINDTLAKHTEIVTCHDAINALKKENVDIFGHVFSDLTYEFAYDFDAKQFVVMKGDEIECAPSGYQRNENNFSYFKFTDVYNGNSKYSQYLIDNYAEPETLYVTTGIDVGNHKDIKNVTYAGSVGFARNVKIRTYCDYLTIHAGSDDVSYYGVANNIFVNEVKTFDIYGSNAYVQLRDGETTFKNGSSTDFLEIPTAYQDEVKVNQESENAKIFCKINAPVEIDAYPLSPEEVSTDDEFKEALGSKAFIRLTWDIHADAITITEAMPTIIDLNGFSITMNGNLTIAEGASCYLIDTENSYNDNSGIIFSDVSYIEVNGFLLMNGGNIFASYSADYTIHVDAGGQFDMYGGQIVSDNEDETATIWQSESSKVNIYYGTITSSANMFYNYGGILNITAGKFLTTINNDYLFWIADGQLDISGGKFIADSCMLLKTSNDKESEVNITGGSFYSEGKYAVKDFGSFGSTIAISSSPNSTCTVNIDNANLYSHYAYAFDVVGDEPNEIAINCNSGTYDYYLGDGIKVDEGLEEKVTIKKGGTWTEHSYA